MRRAALVSILALLAFSAVALGAGSATLTVNPNKAGAGSVTTLEATPPNGNKTPRAVALKVVKGVKVDTSAVAGRCKDAQAKQNACPAGSRIGAGRIDVTATPGGKFVVDVALYLGHKRRASDVAGVVGIATLRGTTQKGHSFGRVFRIDQGRLGLETLFGGLDKALAPPPGVKVRIDHLKLHFGKHRQVNGKRHDLITNPSKCPSKGWPYAAIVRYPDGTGKTFNGSVVCTP